MGLLLFLVLIQLKLQIKQVQSVLVITSTFFVLLKSPKILKKKISSLKLLIHITNILLSTFPKSFRVFINF